VAWRCRWRRRCSRSSGRWRNLHSVTRCAAAESAAYQKVRNERQNSAAITGTSNAAPTSQEGALQGNCLRHLC